ncbi:hypothetical protein HY637_01780 [Candidatus Woesearchaeota archaeon]|nr:hypothetical protein [Candidatus Woesearchaeota archaeon]
MKDPYLGTTASELDHYFRNEVGMARNCLLKGEKERAQAKKAEANFVNGLERAIAENLPEFKGVTQQHLREMTQLAQSGDWADIRTIKALYRRYYEITGKPFDEQKLFKGR